MQKPRGRRDTEEAIDAGTETRLEAPQNEDDALYGPLGAIEIGDSSSFPLVSDSIIRDDQDVETCHGEDVHEVEYLFGSYFVKVEDVTDLGDLDVPRKSSNDASLSFKLTNQFSVPSVDPEHKQPLIISISEDSQVFSAS